MAAGVLALMTLAGCGTEEPQKVGEVSEGTPLTGRQGDGAGDEETTTTGPKVYAIGDIVVLGDLKLTVHGVEDPLPPTNTYITARPGNRFVGVDVEVQNITDAPVSFLGGVAFELQDSENHAYDTRYTDHQPPVPDGELQAQGTKRGVAVFDIPDASTDLRLNFTGDPFSRGGAVVKLS